MLSKKMEVSILRYASETRPDACGECFCEDLCTFLLMRNGVLTTCGDFRNRVRKVVDREIEKVVNGGVN